MNERKLSRRVFMRACAVAASAALVGACKPKIVEVTKIVEKPVEKVVEKTVIVAGTPRVVKETIIIEKIATAQPVKERVALRFLNKWGSGVRRTLINGFLDEWADKHPDIGVIFEPIADFDRRMPVLMAAGEVADVMLYTNNQQNDYYTLTKELTPYFETDKEVNPPGKGDIVAAPKDVRNLQNRFWGIPFQMNIITSGINKDLFKKAGVPMPWEYNHAGDKWWDWNDYRQSAMTIQKLGGDIWGAIYNNANWEQTVLYNFTYSNGGKFYDVSKMESTLNTPEVIEAQNFAIGMICKDKCMMPWDVFGSVQGSLGIDPFFAGKVGITPRADLGPLALSKDKFDGCQVAWVRSPRTKKAAGYASMHLHVMSKDTKYPNQAWELMKFLSNFANQKKIALSGTCEPIRNSVWQDADYQKAWDPNTREARLDNLKAVDYQPATRGFQAWIDELVVRWTDVVSCKKPVEQAVVEMDTALTAILRKQNPPIA